MSSFYTKIVRVLEQARDRWWPTFLIRPTDNGFQYSRFADGVWTRVDSLQASRNIFEQRILLIPDSLSLFKLRQFPAGSVSRQSLNEAVELDLARWSPWREDNEFYFWPKLRGDQWQVAVWVWQREELATITDSLTLRPTHIMPDRAWQIASLDVPGVNFVHIDVSHTGTSDKEKEAGRSWVYAGMREDFSSLSISSVRTESDAKRFRLALASGKSPLRYYVNEQALDDTPDWENQAELSTSNYRLPESAALSMARQPGISDWSDPFVWAKPTGAILALYIVWLLGNGLVSIKHGQEMQDLGARASSVSIEVLDARAEVEQVNALLETVDQLRTTRTHLEALLASLSKTLPRNAWLEHIEYRGDDGGWLEITGKSTQSSTLAAVLERMPEVEQAMFLNDIRRDNRTGLEPFKIRLKLKAGE